MPAAATAGSDERVAASAFLSRRLAAWLVAVLVALSVASSAGAQGTLENDVKAAFLYNFTKFIEWPAAPPAGNPFRICVVGDPALARSLDSIIEGEVVQGHPLTRVDLPSASDARECQVLYVGRAEADRGLRLAASLRQAPVLVVGDAPRFAQQGGAIGFVLEDNRVRFDVNSTAMQRAGLKVSSKLLRVARSVHESGGPR